MMGPHRLLTLGVLAAGCLAMVGLTACSENSDGDVVRSKQQMLAGTWDLQAAQEVTAGEFEFSYKFVEDGSVRQRIGGAFLAELRDIEEVRDALEDEPLADLSRLDGGNVNWVGSWTLAGDSLTVTYDLLIVDVFGDVPILGKVTVPVFHEELPPTAQRTLGFTCQIEGDLLSLRGESFAADIDVTTLEGPAAQAADLALQFLGEQIVAQGLDTHTFVHR